MLLRGEAAEGDGRQETGNRRPGDVVSAVGMSSPCDVCGSGRAEEVDGDGESGEVDEVGEERLRLRLREDPGDFLNRPTPLRFRVWRWLMARWQAVMRWLDDGMKGMPPPGFGAP